MYTGAGPLRELRAQARAALPAQAFLRRDRGSALFVSDAPLFAPELRELPDFLCGRRGRLLTLLPDAAWVMRWERRTPQGEGSLCASLLRFRGEPAPRENLELFARAAKLLDGHPAPGEVASLERALRSSAAVALRAGGGGGLCACALLLEQISAKR